MAAYTVIARIGPRVERSRFHDLDAALEAVEARGRELAGEADAPATRPPLMRRFEPVQQVVARLELTGPRRLRAGIDVRGDGSTEAYTGRLRRRVLDQRPRESAYQALRRSLAGGG